MDLVLLYNVCALQSDREVCEALFCVQKFLLKYEFRHSLKGLVYVYHGEQSSFGWGILVKPARMC